MTAPRRSVTTTAPRRIIVLLPPGTAPDAAQALAAAAAALAARCETRLDVVELLGPGDAGVEPVPLALRADWWRCVHPQLQRVDADAVLAMAPQALAAAGHAPDEDLLLLLPPGSTEDAAPRLAWRLEGAALGKVSGLALAGREVQARRPAWGGRVALALTSDAPVCVASWRPAQAQAVPSAVDPTVHDRTLDAGLPPLPAAEPVPQEDAMPPLEGARLVVAGGRGMDGEEGFGLLRGIAERLGAALGGSLPAVDAGLVPVARQVGQSGKFVGARTYLAVGISGTPQHLAGVSADTRIVAINKDREAPIFGVAEVGVVADWRELLPLLDERLRALAADRPPAG